MILQHPKAVRRFILQKLYAAYMADPLEMLGPEDFLRGGEIGRHALAVAIHYLRDDALVEVMLGYQPPLFTSARLTPRGIDVVENPFEFDRRFPPQEMLGGQEPPGVGQWLYQLQAEADLCNLPRPARATLLRDMKHLAAELAQPYEQWRHEVIRALLAWIEQTARPEAEALPALAGLRELLQPLLEESPPA